MDIELKYLEMHSAFFVGGKNMPAKVDPKKITGVKLFLNREEQLLKIYYNGEWIESHQGNALTWTLAKLEDGNYPPVGFAAAAATPTNVVTTTGAHPTKRGTAKTAQVSDPTRGMR